MLPLAWERRLPLHPKSNMHQGRWRGLQEILSLPCFHWPSQESFHKSVMDRIQERAVGTCYVNFKRCAIHGVGFPDSSAGKESTCSAGDPDLISGSGRSPGEGIGYPLQCSCLENPHELRSLAGCSPVGCTESDVTERVSPAPVYSCALCV